MYHTWVLWQEHVKFHAEQEVHAVDSGKHPVHIGSSVIGSGNTASSLQVTGLAWLAKSCQLGMAKNAFDYQYEGCIEEMERKAPQF